MTAVQRTGCGDRTVTVASQEVITVVRVRDGVGGPVVEMAKRGLSPDSGVQGQLI